MATFRPEIADVIVFLKDLKLAILPVVLAQPADLYPAKDKQGNILREKNGNPKPAFTGKNPSYLDRNGKPHLINHRDYQDRLPTNSEHKTWFANPENGIGCLGGNNGIYFIDLDRKHFETQEDCDRAAAKIQIALPGETWIERTRNGGYRIAVQLGSPPGFTNFALEPGGKHVGEVIGRGRFVVLAPTIDYECLHCCDPVFLESIEQADIYSTKVKRSIEARVPKVPLKTVSTTAPIALEDLLTDNARAVLRGEDIKGNRSESLTLLIQEAFGWENWCNENGILFSGIAEDLTTSAGEKLGIDSDRISRILKTVDITICTPSAWHRDGDEGCWLKIRRLSRLVFESSCSLQLRKKIESAQPGVDQDGTSQYVDQEFPFLVVNRLYSDTRWICLSGKLYRREVTHYEAQLDAMELQRIQALAESVSYYCRKRNREVFSFAKPSAIKNALEWVKIKFTIDPSLCNPNGVNCLNGVLTFDENNQPVLTPHNSDQYFLYKPTTRYDPDAPTEACDRLLAAMRPAQVEVFLKTIAAIFDMTKTRLKVGRLRALLAIGTGSNGKDALRHAISILLGGTGMSDVTLEDFSDHDSGRKFNTARLRGSVVNWASENRPGVNLDKLKTLMRAVTGETLTYELKGRDSEDYQSKAVHIFNLNELPNIRAAMEATKTRFAPIAFDKTFKVNPDLSKGESQADTRLKEDPDFVAEQVLPGLLSRLVQAYQDLMRDGIDYSSCDQILEEIQIHNSHLLEFANETGLEFNADSVLPIKELWAALENYYKSTGVLTYSPDGRHIWEDPIRPGDLYVRGPNQITNRFIALFPKCKKVPLGGNRYGLRGLRFAPVVVASEPAELDSVEEEAVEVITSESSPLLLDSKMEPESVTVIRYTIAFKQAAQQCLDGKDDRAIVQLIEELKPQPIDLKRAIWNALPSELNARIKRILEHRPDLVRTQTRA